MAKRDLPSDPWAATTREGSRRATLLAGARMTLAEKLERLEEFNTLARRFAQPRGGRRADGAAGASQPKPL